VTLDPRAARVHKALDHGQLAHALRLATDFVEQEELAQDRGPHFADAHGLKGIVHFQLGDWPAALPHFHTNATVRPTRAGWFRVSLCAALARQPGTCEQAFASAMSTQPRDKAEASLTEAFMRYDLLQALVNTGQYALAFEHLSFLRRAYVARDSTSPDQLLKAGLPVLAHTLQQAERLFRMWSEVDGPKWFSSLAVQLDQLGAMQCEDAIRRLS
jgi:hypothetical protein